MGDQLFDQVAKDLLEIAVDSFSRGAFRGVPGVSGGVEPWSLPAGGRVRLSRAVAGRLRAGWLHYASAHSGRSRNSSLRSSDNHARFPPWADPCPPLACARSLRPLRGRNGLFGGVFFRPRVSLRSTLGAAVRYWAL